ncbi:hypothetical protein LIA77_06557 [Sarocladium implicatum]|nr:hypothetical protein LIA77_06557 [Sarocladium implicatum]
MDTLIEKKAIQLAYVTSLFTAVNKSCRQMNGITYASGNADNERVLPPFETFLCKLAQICDTEKGGDTSTGMAALRGDSGPKYLFAQNNRKVTELESSRNFLEGILTLVGVNPGSLGVKAMQKAVLWRVLEFNFPRVKLYLNQVKVWVKECIENCDVEAESNLVQALKDIEVKSHFPCEITAGDSPRAKFLKGCEALIKAIQAGKENGFSEGINRFASASGAEASHPWLELRHHLGRLHSYRLAAETIVNASSLWPELFQDFTVEYIPSSLGIRLSLTHPTPSMRQVIHMAFPERDLEEFNEEIQELEYHGLRGHVQDELRHKSLRQFVHCEVHLENFLIGDEKTDASQYWNNSKFIATSKPPCRLCHYYFDDGNTDFEVQSSHMNVYPKWRLPAIDHEQQDSARERQKERLEDIIEQMQQDTLRIFKERLPQWKRNDSRTESRGLTTAMSSFEGEGSSMLGWNRSSTRAGGLLRGSDFGMQSIPSRLDEDFNFVDARGVGAAV